MEIRYNKTKPVDYAKLMLRCGAGRINARVITKSIRDSLLTVGMYEDDELVAFGRIVGDGHIYFILCDIMVSPDYRCFGYEMQIFKEMNDFVLEFANAGSRIYVLADRPFDEDYRKFGYTYLDPDNETVLVK